MSWTMTPTVCDRDVTRALAEAIGLERELIGGRRTLARVAWLTG